MLPEVKKYDKESLRYLVQKLNSHDLSARSINKERFEHTMHILNYIANQKIPNKLNKNLITLFALYDYFQQQYVLKPYTLYPDVMEKILHYVPWKAINIVSKTSNFPHLIGISTYKNDTTIMPHKEKIKTFLNGVLYQWILIEENENFDIDFSKIEVFPWIRQTLSNPTYILPRTAIQKDSTKISADLFFIKNILDSDKYSFHLVALKNESNNNFTIVSQFAIEKTRFYRLKKMFDLSKAIYVYKNPDKLGAGRVGL